MLIGKDFDKIEIELFGYLITEPNGFLTDTLMAFVSLVLAYYVYKLNVRNTFTKLWYYFFLIYGISSFSGGLGHAFYSYWSIYGKFFNWLTGVFSIYILELAMISIVNSDRQKKLFRKLSLIKVILVYITITLVIILLPVAENPGLAFLPIAINTIVGVILTAGILGYKFSKELDANYKYFYYGVLIMVPSAFIFLGKINPHPWFDKNDLSHILLSIGIIFFYLGVKKTQVKQ